MAKPARSPAQESRRSDWLEPLTDAVNRLTDPEAIGKPAGGVREIKFDFPMPAVGAGERVPSSEVELLPKYQ